MKTERDEGRCINRVHIVTTWIFHSFDFCNHLLSLLIFKYRVRLSRKSVLVKRPSDRNVRQRHRSRVVVWQCTADLCLRQWARLRTQHGQSAARFHLRDFTSSNLWQAQVFEVPGMTCMMSQCLAGSPPNHQILGSMRATAYATQSGC